MSEFIIPIMLILLCVLIAVALFWLRPKQLKFSLCTEKPALPENFKLAWELVQLHLAKDTAKSSHSLARITNPITGERERFNFIYEVTYGGFKWNHQDIEIFLHYTLEGENGTYYKPDEQFVSMIMSAYTSHNLQPSEDHELYEF